jgi:hypothetical protein
MSASIVHEEGVYGYSPTAATPKSVYAVDLNESDFHSNGEHDIAFL